MHQQQLHHNSARELSKLPNWSFETHVVAETHCLQLSSHRAHSAQTRRGIQKHINGVAQGCVLARTVAARAGEHLMFGEPERNAGGMLEECCVCRSNAVGNAGAMPEECPGECGSNAGGMPDEHRWHIVQKRSEGLLLRGTGTDDWGSISTISCSCSRTSIHTFMGPAPKFHLCNVCTHCHAFNCSSNRTTQSRSAYCSLMCTKHILPNLRRIANKASPVNPL